MHLCFRILLFLRPEVHVYFALFCPHSFLLNSLKAAPWFSRAHHHLCLSHEGHPSAQNLRKARMVHGFCFTDAWIEAQRRKRFAQGSVPVAKAGTLTPHASVKSHFLSHTSLPKPKPQCQNHSVKHKTWTPRHKPTAACNSRHVGQRGPRKKHTKRPTAALSQSGSQDWSFFSYLCSTKC